jgi:hypothetical protein
MSLNVEPGAGLLYMKVGTHAQETLTDIIARKTKEIENEGFAFWGYGGSTCHPTTMVQPFAKAYEQRGRTLYLVMEPMESKHFADPIRADEYSVDGITWNEIPPAIGALGSRYALVISSLETQDFELALNMTKVALGRSEGAAGSKYIKGRVDKACLEVLGAGSAFPDEERMVKIGLVAELKRPYAVFLRNRRQS